MRIPDWDSSRPKREPYPAHFKTPMQSGRIFLPMVAGGQTAPRSGQPKANRLNVKETLGDRDLRSGVALGVTRRDKKAFAALSITLGGR